MLKAQYYFFFLTFKHAVMNCRHDAPNYGKTPHSSNLDKGSHTCTTKTSTEIWWGKQVKEKAEEICSNKLKLKL
jgi:hypothetical protein